LTANNPAHGQQFIADDVREGLSIDGPLLLGLQSGSHCPEAVIINAQAALGDAVLDRLGRGETVSGDCVEQGLKSIRVFRHAQVLSALNVAVSASAAESIALSQAMSSRHADGEAADSFLL